MAVTSSPGNTRAFNGVKVFSATMVADRERLGETVTAWIHAHPELTIVDLVQTQSSDAAFHCIAITLFYCDADNKANNSARPKTRHLAAR